MTDSKYYNTVCWDFRYIEIEYISKQRYMGEGKGTHRVVVSSFCLKW